ncbi:HAD family hydrolase [Planobispora siamensis]|uniref:Haloacid dehalogenase superfamily, subfamily IA, variant 3 with third motif having DD or ED n=1 Tax=Planobispora siamensis TaxID=936338 RepID=A0A8J3WM04_9ACTN|nr:HAD-IA family hydrolase [Planobispora siamensis]GIH94175.1 hypothetical protein Psi01_48050 [Planobispora siamensis]
MSAARTPATERAEPAGAVERIEQVGPVGPIETVRAAGAAGPIRPAGVIGGRRVWFCDLDGTLVDSGPVHEVAFREAIAQLAPELLASFRYDAHAGASTREVVTGLGADGALAERLIRCKQRLYRERVAAGAVPVLPGAHRFLRHLADRGHTAYLVTAGSRGSVERVLAACSLDEYFRDVLTGDDAPVSKPDPGFYLHACLRWGVGPAEAVAVEDSGHGVASALGAGLVTFQVGRAVPVPGAIPVRDLDGVLALLRPQGRGGGPQEIGGARIGDERGSDGGDGGGGDGGGRDGGGRDDDG